MPADFERCVQDGGKVRTVTGPSKSLGLRENEYVRLCIFKGVVHRGEVRRRQRKAEQMR